MQRPPFQRLHPTIAFLLEYRVYWVLPMVLTTAIALGYALVRKPLWEASQAIIVRDEAIGGFKRPGSFETVDSMKTAQETVWEMARSRQVVTAALKRIGPPASHSRSRQWPSLKQIEQMQSRVYLRAPRGTEFGKTEVIYLVVREKDRQRAVRLAQAIGDELDERLKSLRDQKASSLITELANIVKLAEADLALSTKGLTAIEREVGSDLGELRVLNEAGAGESNLRQTLIQIRTELRQLNAQERTTQQLLTLLEAAQRDPGNLLATPSELLESQPALKQLKDGLVQSQLLTAGLLGEMSPEHPRVKAALVAQQQIQDSLHAELETAIRGVEAQLHMLAQRSQTIQQQLDDVTRRMDRLAGLRAAYGNLVAEVKQRSDVLQQAEQNLAAARASQAAAHAASLLTRLDQPVTGSSPLGPRRAVIVLAGACGGLLLGMGMLLLMSDGFTLHKVQPPLGVNGHAVEDRAPHANNAETMNRSAKSNQRSAKHALRLTLRQALMRTF